MVGPTNYDPVLLQEARESYAQALTLDEHDLYAALNVAKVDVMLSKHDPARLNDARTQFYSFLPLCEFEVRRKPNDIWRKFDLADALLFSGQYKEALEQYHRTVTAIPKHERADIINSVRGPLVDISEVKINDQELHRWVNEALKLLDNAD